MDRFTAESSEINPVQYTNEECEFIIKHLGEPPAVALKDLPQPGVVKGAVERVLNRVYDLVQIEKYDKGQWAGVDKVKEGFQVWLDQSTKWKQAKDRFPRAPRFPSMHSFDAKNRPHRGGPSSDSGQVRTYFDEQGERKSFIINLFGDNENGGWQPDWVATAAPKPQVNVKGITVDYENRRIECPVCKHTESFKSDSRASENAARARMSKHLRKATDNQELHRELHTNEFGN